jgi:hypothetical protein
LHCTTWSLALMGGVMGKHFNQQQDWLVFVKELDLVG